MLRILTAAALLTLAATAVQAQPLYLTPENAQITVSYGDLDLSSPSDTKILADRLQTAAKQVCSDTNAGVPKNIVNFCIDSAISIATSDIESKVVNHMGDEVHANLSTMRQQISLN